MMGWVEDSSRQKFDTPERWSKEHLEAFIGSLKLFDDTRLPLIKFYQQKQPLYMQEPITVLCVEI